MALRVLVSVTGLFKVGQGRSGANVKFSVADGVGFFFQFD